MMRLAVLSDLHGNLTALRAVLEDVGQRRIDEILVLGDLAAGGPSPAAVIEAVADLEGSVVVGSLLDRARRGSHPGAARRLRTRGRSPFVRHASG